MRYGHAIVISVVSAGLLAAAPAAFAANARDCPDVADPPAAVCQPATHGLAYADTQDDVRLAATALDAAAVQFGEIFGRSLPPGLLVLSSTFSGDDAQQFAQTHGLSFAQSWLSPADKRAQIEIVMRRATPDADAARMESIFSQIEAQHVDTLRHELGHAQYRAAFWPDAAPSPDAYGTSAPDWLDEASAVLMEGRPGRALRERHFLEAWRQSSPAIQPLAEFLTMAHPVTAQKRALMQAQSGTQTASGVQVMAMRGPDADAGGMFYSQSLLFADFLIDASPDPQVLGMISAALSDDVDFSDWLTDNGARHGLPTDVTALQHAWDIWCEARATAASGAAG
ncbi:MAG: hypothetical protein ABW163_01185 [Luteimonas sp.]